MRPTSAATRSTGKARCGQRAAPGARTAPAAGRPRVASLRPRPGAGCDTSPRGSRRDRPGRRLGRCHDMRGRDPVCPAARRRRLRATPGPWARRTCHQIPHEHIQAAALARPGWTADVSQSPHIGPGRSRFAAGRLRSRPARITGVRATWSLVRRATPQPRRTGRSVAPGALPGRVGRDVEPRQSCCP
jgi:hypothetical protein